MPQRLKLVNELGNGRVVSTPYECPHFTVDQREDGFYVQFPGIDNPALTEIVMPRDGNVLYHMNDAGDTIDSWRWNPETKVARHTRHDR